jgi:hypothetical protein
MREIFPEILHGRDKIRTSDDRQQTLPYVPSKGTLLKIKLFHSAETVTWEYNAIGHGRAACDL